jgi:hypothetical protein
MLVPPCGESGETNSAPRRALGVRLDQPALHQPRVAAEGDDVEAVARRQPADAVLQRARALSIFPSSAIDPDTSSTNTTSLAAYEAARDGGGRREVRSR